MSSSSASDSLETLTQSVFAAEAGGKSKTRWSRQVAADMVGFFDILVVIAGSAVPAMIYGTIGGLVSNPVLLLQSSLAAAIITHMCLRTWGMYETTQMHDFPQHPARLMVALIVGVGGVIGLGLPHAIKFGHMWVWFFTWLSASYTLLLMNRGIAHYVLARLTAAGRFDQRIAVFGAGNIARRVHDYLSQPSLGIQFAGVYDDRIGEDRINPEGLVVAGKLDDLIKAALAEKVDQIIVALPQSADQRISMIARKLEHLPASVHIVTHISSDLVDKGTAHKVSNLGPVGMIDVKKKPLADWAPHIKSVEDCVLGTILLALALPLFPILALAVKLDSPGPIFFHQRRRGLNQRIIEIIKFRTMHVLEDGTDVRQATQGDVRITRIGRILRRTSLDELPQLWNVLRGDMSLVGPRPHALVHDEKFGELLESYANRHQVKPGLTGLAQVRGLRGETTTDTVEARVNADMDYIKTWSLSLDMKILAQTVWAVLQCKNAH